MRKTVVFFYNIYTVIQMNQKHIAEKGGPYCVCGKHLGHIEACVNPKNNEPPF